MGEDPRFSSRNNPSGMTLLEFREKYDYIVRAVVIRQLPRDLHDHEDAVSEIWTQFMIGNKGRSYLEIYDPKKSAPTTFMWAFSLKRVKQFRSKADRTPTARAYSIRTQSDDLGDMHWEGPGIVNSETTPELGRDEYVHIEFEDLLSRATKAIRGMKVKGKRDLKWVWRLLLDGQRQDQIAKEMRLSEGTISICVELIRQVPEVQELRKWAVEHGLIKDDTLALH